ncbi:hypothetical protein [Flaviaesturariibacter terrae]
MKHLALALSTVLISAAALAQAPGSAPLDPTISRQADSLRALYIKNGFILMKENALTMESQYEFPVMVPLKAGTIYQFVFIGEMSSRLYEVRMYDEAEKQVFYKKHMWGDIDGNIIAYPYTPQHNEYHLMRVLQINKQKKKDLSGYVMLFRRTHSALELEEQAERMKAPKSEAPPAAATDSVPAAAAPRSDTTTKKKNHYDQYLTGN